MYTADYKLRSSTERSVTFIITILYFYCLLKFAFFYRFFSYSNQVRYQAGLTKEESTSELLRFTIRHILNQLHNNLLYPILEEQEEKQNKAQNNQQQLVNPVTLPSTTVAASHQYQSPNNISHRNSLVGQKMTPWKLSSLLSMEKTRHTFR